MPQGKIYIHVIGQSQIDQGEFEISLNPRLAQDIYIQIFLLFLGAMYMLIRINVSSFRDIENDKDFFSKLLCEESISCLPASVKNLILYY